jgi:Trm5-related predicted tRNA methylase
MVDIIGIVEDIEEKTSYKNVNTFQEQRDVVRLIVRNAFKTVRINFWADHINILNSLSLKKKQAIVLEDIKKRKSIFLDYMAESNIIMLDEDS